MSTLTTNYSLVKYEASDVADLTGGYNTSMGILDTQIKMIADELASTNDVVASKQDALDFPLTIEQGGTGVATQTYVTTVADDEAVVLRSPATSTTSAAIDKAITVSNLATQLKDLIDTDTDTVTTVVAGSNVTVTDDGANNYTVSVATADNTTLGVVKTTTALVDIDEANWIFGKSYLNASDQLTPAILKSDIVSLISQNTTDYTLPVATSTTLGGVKVSDTLATSLDRFAAITYDDSTGTLAIQEVTVANAASTLASAVASLLQANADGSISVKA